MILSSTSQTLEVTTGSNVDSLEPEVYVAFVDITTTTFVPGTQRTVLPGGPGAEETVVSAPAASTTRQVKYMTIFNRDVLPMLFTVSHQETATEFLVGRFLLDPNEMAEFVWEKGWTVYDAGGFARTNTGSFASAWAACYGTVTSGQLSVQGTQGLTLGMDDQSVTAIPVPNFNSSFWRNIHAQGITSLATMLLTNNGTLTVFPLNPCGDLRFPGVMTVSSMYMGMSGSQTNTAASSTSAAYTWSLGLYTLNGSTLSLLNSGTATASIGSGSQATSGLHGPRFLNFATAGWSAPIELTNGVYFLGVVQTTAGTTRSLAWLGGRLPVGFTWSGFLGQQTSSASDRGMLPFAGLMATAGIPTTIQNSQLNKTNVNAGMVPYILLNNFSSIV
jgi:hypothetical protein